ncbi:hypothetical protein C0Q70_16591 [Pomacea canaliculata]|uniref:Uncharacterized protein n=1 Tax=Pomacea canaliculata TaxID=400727 RepID=A0A2T7NQA1_POMCA|nr:hypothetical protein C0Q70_16591 [Pomacea canaliculata]
MRIGSVTLTVPPGALQSRRENSGYGDCGSQTSARQSRHERACCDVGTTHPSRLLSFKAGNEPQVGECRTSCVAGVTAPGGVCVSGGLLSRAAPGSFRQAVRKTDLTSCDEHNRLPRCL